MLDKWELVGLSQGQVWARVVHRRGSGGKTGHKQAQVDPGFLREARQAEGIQARGSAGFQAGGGA